MPGDVKVNLKPLERFSRLIHDGLRLGTGPIADAVRQWAVRYRSFAQERFDRYSKGGGDWPSLKLATIRRRRHGKGGRYKRGAKAHKKALATGGGQISMLRDTGTMFRALSPVFGRTPGQLQELIPFGIRVGFGGPAGHPGGPITVAELAEIHHEGKGNVPAREIIVDPPQSVTDRMATDARRGIEKAQRQAES